MFQDIPGFQKLIESHEEFHKLAGILVSDLQLNSETEAIESHEKLIGMSQKVIDYLHVLQENS